ncbi:MAG: hypothetical protein AMJ88_18850 [Anaerolineae bacterium SM23_ 63]|nr:MAG: hypothetical protein AMJ88_18850 [Anaerolineae bacterium SM23_ 63]
MTDPSANIIDYLVIGHVSNDLTPNGPILGGTVAYAGRTAQALGMKVRVITSAEEGFDLNPLENMEVLQLPSRRTTTYENRYNRWTRSNSPRAGSGHWLRGRAFALA